MSRSARLMMELATVERLLARPGRASLRDVSGDARVYQVDFDVRTVVRGQGCVIREEERRVRVIYDLASDHPASRPMAVACDPELFNPNINDPTEPSPLPPLPYVCLGSFHPSQRLADWMVATYRLLAWQRVAADHPLNLTAAAWARAAIASGRFPVDPRPFLDAAPDAPAALGSHRALRLRSAGESR